MPSVHQRHDSFALICVNLRLNAVLRINGARIMKRWYMVTVVGKDRPGIVAGLTEALYRGGANLGEASMARLGGNFTIMLMVQIDGEPDANRCSRAPPARASAPD